MRLFLLFLLVFAGSAAFSQDITGKWYGYPDLKDMRLRLVFDIEQTGDNTYKSTLFIPDQSAALYTAGRTTYENGVLSVSVAEAGFDCEGRLQQNGHISGTVTREGYAFPLDLSREPVVFERPQTPGPPFPYRSEEVVFRNEEAGIDLAGTLTFPEKGRSFPAVVLISGSGQQDRDGSLFEHKPFWVIADYLTRRGIAVLRVDDRGAGGSGGVFSKSSIPEAETDVRAAIGYLKSRPEIRAACVGVAGHSEGGFTAFCVAARKDAAFVITLAGGGVNGRELLLMQRAALLRASGAKEEFIARYNEYMGKAQDIALQTANFEACQRRLEELFAGSPLAGQAYTVARQLFNPNKIGLLKYDPEWDFPDISCPVLALNGEKDLQVPAENLQFIRKGISANGNPDVTVKSYPGLNHMFQTAGSGLPAEYSDIEETFNQEVLEDMAGWILELTKK